MPETGRISPLDAARDANCVILDVRTDIEHRAAALRAPHVHVPLDRLKAQDFARSHGLGAGRALYILCRSGKRAAMAAEAFAQAGHANVHVVEGGIIAAEAAGLPVRRGGAVPLERQVRIAAGLLVLAGAALGFLLSPWFHALSAFAGAGLVFAGVTDTCGMALLLAKAPWNRDGEEQPVAACAAAASAGAAAPAPENALKVRMPQGISFYSPAEGTSSPAPVHAPAKTGKSAGGCS